MRFCCSKQLGCTDMGEKEKCEMDHKNEDHTSYSPSLSSDWRFDDSNLTNSSMGLVQPGNSMAIGKCDLTGSSSRSSAPMAETFAPTPWERPTTSQNLGFCDIGVQNNAGTLSMQGTRNGSPTLTLSGVDRALDMCWNPSNSMFKGSLFLPNMPGVIPQSLTQLPTDSAFIERAARFSSFNGGNFSDFMNPFVMPENMGLYSTSGGMMYGGHGIFAGSGLRQVVSGLNCQRSELNVTEASKDASVTVEPGPTEACLLKNETNESLVKSHDEEKQVIGGSGNESDEAEFSNSAGIGQDQLAMLECMGGETSARGITSKKRKRNGPDSDDQARGASHQPGELTKDNTELQHKGDQIPGTTTNKTTVKNGKQGSQASDPTKEEYIHVRARRGQATNSHSLAERVRREKISERMKFLQDLVPGCSKVTGKAVMLDEIINYVQSLQRQVEFLSMKLATVNPRLDFNLEGLLAKDMLQPRVVGSSSSLAYPPDIPMSYPTLQPPHQGLIQPGLLGIGSASDILRRTISSQLTPLPGRFKEPTQLLNEWEDDLNSVVQMSFGTRTSPSSQDADGSQRTGQMKVEL